MRNLLLSTATVLLAGAAFAAAAQSAELPKGAAHNIVLVHGAFVDQSSWKPVADILTKQGYNVTLVENPLTSLAADVDATKQALAKQDGVRALGQLAYYDAAIMHGPDGMESIRTAALKVAKDAGSVAVALADIVDTRGSPDHAPLPAGQNHS